VLVEEGEDASFSESIHARNKLAPETRYRSKDAWEMKIEAIGTTIWQKVA